jgi:hypothetical protein
MNESHFDTAFYLSATEYNIVLQINSFKKTVAEISHKTFLPVTFLALQLAKSIINKEVIAKSKLAAVE